MTNRWLINKSTQVIVAISDYPGTINKLVAVINQVTNEITSHITNEKTADVAAKIFLGHGFVEVGK